MADIFISYCRKNSEFVRQLYEAFVQEKRDPWIDWKDIPLTADWWQEICNGIEAANTFVFILSQDSLASPVCHLEAAHAIQCNKRLVPVVQSRIDEKQAFSALAA